MSKSLTPTINHVGQFGSLVNAYLVHEEDGLTVVDGLQGDQSDKILQAAHVIGKPIKRVVLTHAHPDHVGAVDGLVAKLPNVEFIVGRRESKALHTTKPELQEGEPADGRKPQGAKVKSTPTRTIEHGEMVGSLRAIWTPGHSVGHLAFQDTRDGALICGDVYSTVGGVATTAGPYWRFPLPGFVTWHRGTDLDSAKRLTELEQEPTILLPGHGKAVERPLAAMRAAVAKRGGAQA